ncbi:hypothetical protein V8F06_005153 [Rhypophila decipiens]
MTNRTEPIAIVGMACRFPGGSDDPSKLWELLEKPRDVVSEIPNDRFHLGRFYHPDGTHHGTTNVRTSYLLDQDVALFDTKFFAIPPSEAEIMDPQQRLLLEVVYEAVDAGGFSLQTLSGSNTAVYVGVMCQDYFALQAQDLNSVPTYAATGIAASNASSRISYFFNWHGPSMTIDTACSSSLVGVYEAVQSLRSGTSQVAVACGTNLLLSAFSYVTESKLGMLSPTGRSRMWDAAADGYARGEGVASVVLKTLSQAIRDGDKIEGVIREIGVNHDGRTKGLTMPSATAQSSLISATYARAGLDPTTKSGRCQYFEAHGTGTPAGDPQEAEALSRAFFPDRNNNRSAASDPDTSDTNGDGDDDVLFVGSIKTVIGHTEGTAGLAGVIKACLALQNKLIPPNLLLEQLNPALDPFTRHLRIAQSSQPWPDLPPGTPHRASVNSFGFGGTNAHAIIEAYSPSAEPSASLSAEKQCHIPVVLSAASDTSLLSVAQSMVEFLTAHPETDLSDLAWTLSTRKSSLARRLSLSASSVTHLREQLEASMAFIPNPNPKLGVQSLSGASSSILGIFTGQGAQWPAMGACLIASPGIARDILASLEASLQSLPVSHRPTWSLAEQLAATKDKSRLSEAAVAQPLCTAVQLMLIGLLRAARVRFSAVVGHSSGEIAAAHAAGFLSATDAIRIAYYRGYYAKLAEGTDGQKGGMLAAGTTTEDAQELCEIDDLVDTLSLAAHNSPTSVTLSGDEQSVKLALDILEEEGKFVRALRVDTAYHSKHMMRSSAAYLAAMRRCRIQLLKPEPEDGMPLWFSSVYDDARAMTANGLEGLDAQYWVDNMTKPVLFYPAVKAAVSRHDLDGFPPVTSAVEVGPHPALQGPAKETIKAVTSRDVPYTGTLRRGTDDVEAFADALGHIWCHFGPTAVDLGGFQAQQQRCSNSLEPRRVSDLPSYPWEHERPLWAESRSSKLFRTQPGQFHDLLGILTADGTAEEWRWRNVLKTSEIKWLSGHALQGQTVFPGTGYIAMAMEAAVELAKGRPIASLDLFDLQIAKAIALHDGLGTELLVSMTSIRDQAETGSGIITAGYAVFSSTGKEASNLTLNCSGHIRVVLGDDWESRFPQPRSEPVMQLASVDVDRFYQVLKDDLGYGYDGPFRSLAKIQRRSGFSTATIANTSFDEDETDLLFHPGMLDSALQGLNAACSAPGDGRLWSIVAPTYFKRVTLLPALCGKNMTETVDIDCTITDARDDRITGDVDVYSAGYEKQIMEIEGVRFSPFAMATASDDRHLFQETTMSLDEPDAVVVFGESRSTPEQLKKGLDAERAAFFYLKNLVLSVPVEDRANLPWYRKALIANAQRLYHQVSSGSHSHAPESWISDSKADIVAMMDSYGDDSDFNLTRAVGEHLLLPEVLKGETSILEFMTQNNGLDRYYVEAIGFEMLNHLVSGVMEQLCTKYPRMNILEVGSGTGGATQAILGTIGSAFSSYAYTDVSSGFFEKAADKFQAHSRKMTFKVLDIENEVTEQGFPAASYDVVVASNVLHATKSMKYTLENTRKLLKPGGYLVLLEVIRSDVMRHGLVMGGLPGWWVGFEDGRTTGPSLTLTEWESVLRQSGFSGIETSSPMPDAVTVPGSVFVARAVDDKISLLRTPLSSAPADASHGPLLIIGCDSTASGNMVRQVSSVLDAYFDPVIHISTLDDLPEQLPPDLHVISLAEANANLFETINEAVWEQLKRLLSSTASMLWILRQAHDSNPHAGTTLGLFRTLFYELPGTLLQTLDLGVDVSLASLQASTVAELVLRLKSLTHMRRVGQSDKVLWGFEPELVLQRDGRFHVPRVRQNVAQNARYNSSKRPIKHTVEAEAPGTLLELAKNDNQAQNYSLREMFVAASTKAADLGDLMLDDDMMDSGYEENDQSTTDSRGGGLDDQEDMDQDSDSVTIQVSCSLLSSLKTPTGYYFLQIGREIKTGHKTLCFSDSNTSVVTVPRSFACRVGRDQPEREIVDGQYMSLVVAELMAQQILAILPPSGTIVAYEPDPAVASLLARQIANLGRKVVFLTSKPTLKTRNWTYLPPQSAKRHIDAAIPRDATLYIDTSEQGVARGDLDTAETQRHRLGQRIRPSLPELCATVSHSSMAAATASPLPERAPQAVVRLLRKAAAFAESQLNSIPDGAPLDILPLKQVTGPAPPRSRFSLVYWQIDPHVPVSIEPIFKRDDLFRPDRTYWLAGLGGDLGRSLADFMIARNARNVVISSRTPLVDQGWVDWHKDKTGATIVYHACDLTDFKSTKQVRDSILKSLPPIAGVANGAMVLRDASVVQMTFSQLSDVLRPKVESTLNLDRLFATKRGSLDWFVGFSSIVGTTGNPGQAAYSAGNVFLKTLTRQRRARGLPGSTIDICRVIGVGYIQRESSDGRLTREQQARLATRSGTLAMSEHDLYQAFAEAIVCGRPDSGLDPEIITGLAPISVEEAKEAFWAPNARFGLIVREENADAAGGQGAGAGRGGVPVRVLLEAAKSLDDVAGILLEAVKTKLQVLMFLSDASSLVETTPLVDMGVDSLVGVEMRAWFMKELAVEVPVMKILGGASIAELVEGIMEKLPEDIKGRFDESGAKVESVEVKAADVVDNTVGREANAALVRVVEIVSDEDKAASA